MKIFPRSQTPAARLEFLETALRPQIAEAEAGLSARRAEQRATALRTRDTELAELDAELAQIEAEHAEAGKKLDIATRAFKAAEARAVDTHFARRNASHRREVARGRWSRILGELGNDAVSTALFRLRWVAKCCADRLEREQIVRESKPRPGAAPVVFRRIVFDAGSLALACAASIQKIEALTDAALPVEEIERTCAAEVARCEAIAGESLMRWAPWSLVETRGAH